MRRILICSNLDAPLGELSANDVMALVRREEVNGEHSLEVTTTQVLEQGQRIVYQDGRGIWREYVVYGVDENHASGRVVVGTYYCVWSVQPDLQGVTVSKMPGVQSPVSAGVALSELLSEQSRWSVGSAHAGTGGASMYDMNAWQAMGVLVDNWGGELGVEIGVSELEGRVTTREVRLPARMGEASPRRRFDFGADLKSVRRTVADGSLYCRVSPRGKGEQTGDGYGRKIRISDVNAGKDYLEYAPMVDAAKLPNGNGGYQYPTKIIENPDCETPAELFAWAQGVVADELTPKVTYEVDVVQAAREGVDMQGVSLGDAVDVVDRRFRVDGLRLTARVVAMTVDEITGKSDSVTIGTLQERIASKFSDAGRAALAAVGELSASLSTAAYVNSLLDRINAEVNATGGYTYIVPGEGVIAYNKAVSDPLVGAEADSVVQVKGGSIRIANAKKAGFSGIGDWDFHNVMLADETVVDGATMQHLRTGFIGSPSGNYWNLDTGELSIFPTAMAGGRTIQSIIESADSTSGASNLLMDTDRPTLEKAAATADRYWCNADGVTTRNSIVSLSEDERPVGGVRYEARFEPASGSAGKHVGICFYDNRTTRLVDGIDYTVSCWAKVESSSRGAELFFQYGQTEFVASERMELSQEWRRYSWTFEFGQSRAGGSYGARMYFLAAPTTASQTRVSMTGFKLEIGKKATDWCESAEDVQHRVDEAVAEAKAYANDVSAADRAFAVSERNALDASLDQGKVFERLMTKQDGSRAHGLQIDRNGELYVNGAYIAANTLSGSTIYGGVIQDRQSKNRWDLVSGALRTGALAISSGAIDGQLTCTTSAYGYANKVTVANGGLRFHTSSRRYSGKSDKLMLEMFPQGDAMELVAPNGIYFSTNRLQVHHRGTGSWGNGFTGNIKVVTSVKKSGSKIKVKKKTLQFVNGILVK